MCRFDKPYTIASDPVILEKILEEKFQLIDMVPNQTSCPVISIYAEHEAEVENEIKNLLCKGTIIYTHHEQGGYISPISSMP